MGRLVKHWWRISPEWHGFVWAWHSHKDYRTGWIIFGMSWAPNEPVRFSWPTYTRNL